MNDTRHILLRFSQRLAFQGSILTVLFLGSGCVLQPDADGTEGSTSSLSVNQEPAAKPATDQPGIPKGCSRVWDSNKHDWSLYCPDIAPPKPL